MTSKVLCSASLLMGDEGPEARAAPSCWYLLLTFKRHAVWEHGVHRRVIFFLTERLTGWHYIVSVPFESKREQGFSIGNSQDRAWCLP